MKDNLKTKEIQINLDGLIQMDIPRPCPKCNGKLYSICDANTSFFHVKHRTWIFCKSCSFKQSAEDYKKELLTV